MVMAGWLDWGGALRKHNALGYSCHRDGGIKVTYALVCLCGWCTKKKKKKAPQQQSASIKTTSEIYVAWLLHRLVTSCPNEA